MSFDDYRDLVEPLRLPINGVTYEIRPIPFIDGARLRGVLDGDEIPLEDWFALVLGPAFEQMKADGVSTDALRRAAMTAAADHQRGREIAEVIWKTGGDPKAIRLLTAQSSTGEATTTQKRASTNGTKTSPRPSRAKRK